ncbi:MAG: Na+/H+ antiporter NhaA [Candidatus Eremiobacteraeota bacterium]|nr:Na+/H+ antiporter NhaA [Candidatus Eremiobacteraeota bacterium]
MREFLRSESSAGFALIGASAVGLIWANSSLANAYEGMLHVRLGAGTHDFSFYMTAHEWVNDALMAVFFLLVGLEIKRELLIGELSTFGRAALPAIAAIGGVVLPSLICAAFVWHDPQRARGWAIPAATDIAFALAVLALLGSRIPFGLKVFLTALAVIDDLIAIAIIALFYTKDLRWTALVAVGGCALALTVLKRLRVANLVVYAGVGIVMWWCVRESGIHPTVAGVVLALSIPLNALKRFEHALNPYVAFAILPIFGLFNAGVPLRGIRASALDVSLPLGIALGLFFGKQLGIFGSAWAVVKTGIAPLPHGVTWRMMYGAALLGGIGFTMSLFIGTLAFSSDSLMLETKLGVFGGSALAATAGYLVLRASRT